MKGHCKQCGVLREHLHKDHVVPSWAGGADTADNWQYLCANCHEDKTYAERKTPEYRSFQSQCMKRRMLSPEARQKIADGVRRANTTRKWTPEQRARCGDSTRGRARTTEERQRIGNSLRGKPKTAAHKAALSAARRRSL